MPAIERRDLVIVGGGPGGSGTALALERIAPELAARTLVLDRADFPRDKTCAGGLIPHTLELLESLDLSLDVPSVRVDHARVEAGGSEALAIPSPGCCWVIRRREFDAMLLAAARARGVEVRTGVAVRDASRSGEWIRLETTAGPLEARAVVGADGSGSLVRRRLVDADEGWIARAVMSDVPIDAPAAPDVYEFDFRDVPDGLAGYAWSFPCLIEGRPHWNVGVYSLRRGGEGGRLGRLLEKRAEGVAERKAHPIRLYDEGRPLAAPGVLLVGDAGGVDPLLGEGISFALEYGRHAALTLRDAFAAGDLRFPDYTARIAGSPLGKKLRRLAMGARLFYGPKSAFWFRVARFSRTAQRIGMNWYNGVGLWNPPVVALPRAERTSVDGSRYGTAEPDHWRTTWQRQ
ncbi:MAG: NAD(P)/FAD-dependent oxidoreductase [Deltaproteobacteria bacterium]|nr:NAD(P)/FAD-dependent oxidoreductase [Deltaproteobacteria bacterium]